jgi:antitoxin CptB
MGGMLACAFGGRNAGLCKANADSAPQALYIKRAWPRPGFWRWSETMTGIGISSEGLDERRRRLLFRSWHRGIREMDLVLGRFADAEIAKLSDADLDEYEAWLEVPDQKIFIWVNGTQPAPAEIDTPLFRRLRDFHYKDDEST